jgi:CHAT domain-containing protein
VKLSAHDEDGIDRNSLNKERAEAEQAYNAFLAKVRSQDKEQASLMAVEPLTLKQVQELLDPEQTLLEYFVTDDEVFIWVVEKDRLNFQRVALRRTELTRQVKALREMISNLGNPQQLNEVSASLYREVIQPAIPHITGKELIIVPHNVLHYLPFQALQSTDGRYLIEKYPVEYLSSASLLQFTKEKRKAMGDKVLALGNPDLGDPKLNLQFAEVEANKIKSFYPQSTVLLEKDATEEKAKALLPQNDIVHFATHAQLNENDPLSSAILLARGGKEDGRLEVREIFGMDLHANLVVLSACETGLGKLSSGDELVGLTRAFIYAGTPSVVASLWNVDDSSTAALMASFYKNLKTMSKVEALRQAQLELIKGQASSDLLARRGIGGVGRLGETPSSDLPAPSSLSVSTSHPYFWAPFILVGDGK